MEKKEIMEKEINPTLPLVITVKYFDFKELGKDFVATLKYKDSLRAIGKTINVSASTLSRISHGKTVDVNTLIKICEHLNTPMDKYIKVKKQ